MKLNEYMFIFKIPDEKHLAKLMPFYESTIFSYGFVKTIYYSQLPHWRIVIFGSEEWFWVK